MKKNLFTMVVISFCGFLSAQTIDLEFPYLAGKTYVFAIVQGSNHVEIKKDTIPPSGKVQLQVPEVYKGYKGMALWWLTNSKTGGGLDLVLNNEDFSVRCMDSLYTYTSIVYSNTKENSLLLSSAKEQQPLIEQYDALSRASRVFQKRHRLYRLLMKESQHIEKQYKSYYANLTSSSLYAARFRILDNLSRGIGSMLTQDQVSKAQDFNNFVLNTMDYNDLYTSNHWYTILRGWLDYRTQGLINYDQLVLDIASVLAKLPSSKMYTEYVELITTLLTKGGHDRVIKALQPIIKKDNRLLNYDGVLKLYQKDLTGKAPVFDVIDHRVKAMGELWEHTSTLDFSLMKNKFSVLVFYQSDCGHCEAALDKLVSLYPEWKAKGVELYSISGDTDGKVFATTAAKLPWKHNYCDYKGFDGPGFKAYTIVGTPTFYLIDEKGDIVPDVYTLNELEAWFKLNLTW